MNRALRLLVWVSAIFFVLITTILTASQWAYLQQQGWSPVHRTPTEWPSLLATGPHGWVMSGAFALCGVSVALLGLAVWRQPREGATRTRLIASCLWLAALGLLGITFPADPSTALSLSWHARLHNASYPAIPLGVFVAACILASAQRGEPGRAGSRLLIPVMVVSFALTNFDAISQLARYPAFASLLVWLVVCASSRPIWSQM